MKKDVRLKRLSKRRRSEPLVKDSQKIALRKSIDANILEAKEKMLQRRIDSAKADSSESAKRAVASRLNNQMESDTAVDRPSDLIPTDHIEIQQPDSPIEPEEEIVCGSEANAPNEQVQELREIPHVQLEEQTPEEVELIDCVSDTPPVWELRTWNGEKLTIAARDGETISSDEDDDAALCIDFQDDDLESPMSPPEVITVDRSCVKLIPSEFVEEIISTAYETKPKRSRQTAAAPAPMSPTPSGSPMVTRGKAKLIPASPSSTSSASPDKRSTRSSARRSAKLEAVAESPPLNLTPESSESSKQNSQVLAKFTPTTNRMVTRSQPKVITLLKDSYVAEKEVYETSKLFGYDDIVISGETSKSTTADDTHASKQTTPALTDVFQPRERCVAIEKTLTKVAAGEISMDAALSELVGLNQSKQLYTSFVYVLLLINKKLEEHMVAGLNEAETRLVTFLLNYAPQLEKGKPKTSRDFRFNCVKTIQEFFMSSDRSTKTAVELTSLLKVFSHLASEAHCTMYLAEEIYYFALNYATEAAYLIGCLFAGMPQCLVNIKADSPFGFLVRYVMFHHVTTISIDNLQTARAMALHAGWAPLIQDGDSLDEAIERFVPEIFSKENHGKDLSKIALQSLEIMLILHADAQKTKEIFEKYLPPLLRRTDLSERDLSLLLRLCGKVWHRFARLPVAKIPFEASIESVIDVESRFRFTSRREAKDLCRKSLWSYSCYDLSEVGRKARQVWSQNPCENWTDLRRKNRRRRVRKKAKKKPPAKNQNQPCTKKKQQQQKKKKNTTPVKL